MSYLLDTNVLVALLTGRSERIRSSYERARMEGNPIFISAIVLYELQYGVLKTRQIAANQQNLDGILTPMTSLPFEDSDALEAARIRAELERQKQPIGPFDTLIAGQALARNLTLVTANTREFSRVHGLRWQDWAIAEQ